MKIASAVTLLLCLASPVVLQQNKFSISGSINSFAINLLAATNGEAGEQINLALSPYTVWNLLAIVSEGALDNTAKQLETVLRLPSNKNVVRDSFQNFSSLLQEKSDGANMEISSAIFANENHPVKESYARIVKQAYNTGVIPTNFKDSREAAVIINKYIAKATQNRIPELINQEDVKNAQLFLTSVQYFKGEWKTPFNKSATNRDSFYDEKKNVIGQVDMMYQLGSFPYSRFPDLKTEILELPYGFDGKMSMYILLPRGGQSIAGVLNLLSRESFSNIMDVVDKAGYKFSEDEIHVYIPKFKIASDFNLDRVLDGMGAKDVFDYQKANLLGMFHHYLFLSRFIHRAEIEVDEEGTVATAASGVSFLNRIPPPIFRANKPFIYIIADKKTRSIVFAGKVSNPNNLQ